MNRPHDDYSILVTLKADGSVEKTVVGSVAESLALDSENETDLEDLKKSSRQILFRWQVLQYREGIQPCKWKRRNTCRCRRGFCGRT